MSRYFGKPSNSEQVAKEIVQDFDLTTFQGILIFGKTVNKVVFVTFGRDIPSLDYQALTMAPKRRGIRAILNAQQAREIFAAKEHNEHVVTYAASSTLAKHYNVSSKTIRDIWSGRSWLAATSDLWDPQDRPHRQRVGRPVGRKDSKPRRSKVPRNRSGETISGADTTPATSLGNDVAWPCFGDTTLQYSGRLSHLMHNVESRNSAMMQATPLPTTLLQMLEHREMHLLFMQPVSTSRSSPLSCPQNSIQ